MPKLVCVSCFGAHAVPGAKLCAECAGQRSLAQQFAEANQTPVAARKNGPGATGGPGAPKNEAMWERLVAGLNPMP